MVTAHVSVSEIWSWLQEIADPEIPALSIVDLGMVRDVEWSSDGEELTIAITPTYSGCPAIAVIADEIRSSLEEHGVERLCLATRLSPAWTTDWMTDEAKERLRAYGVAPPSARLIALGDIAPSIVENEPVICPYCGSDATELVSRFSSTACKALYKCRSCLEPFDAFKRH